MQRIQTISVADCCLVMMMVMIVMMVTTDQDVLSSSVTTKMVEVLLNFKWQCEKPQTISIGHALIYNGVFL